MATVDLTSVDFDEEPAIACALPTFDGEECVPDGALTHANEEDASSGVRSPPPKRAARRSRRTAGLPPTLVTGPGAVVVRTATARQGRVGDFHNASSSKGDENTPSPTCSPVSKRAATPGRRFRVDLTTVDATPEPAVGLRDRRPYLKLTRASFRAIRKNRSSED